MGWHRLLRGLVSMGAIGELPPLQYSILTCGSVAQRVAKTEPDDEGLNPFHYCKPRPAPPEDDDSELVVSDDEEAVPSLVVSDDDFGIGIEASFGVEFGTPMSVPGSVPATPDVNDNPYRVGSRRSSVGERRSSVGSAVSDVSEGTKQIREAERLKAEIAAR